jgi:hypothetical protein
LTWLITPRKIKGFSMHTWGISSLPSLFNTNLNILFC